MRTRTAALSVLPLAVVLAVSGCTAEAPPPPGGDAAGSAAPAGDPVPSVDPVADPAAVLEVADQKSEGPTVLVRAAATKGGIVVVYGDDGRNELGSNVIEPGTEPRDVQISLAEEPTEQIALIARLFADTDGNGLFSAPDRPVTNGKDDDNDDPKVFPGEQETFQFTGKKVVKS